MKANLQMFGGRGGGSGLSGGGASREETNYLNQTEAEWEANNARIERDFADWLDSNDKKAFEADQYNIYEKMTLKEAQKYLKPESEKGFSYNSDDYVPADTSYFVQYSDGTSIGLGEGDSLKGVKRTGIDLVVQQNEASTIIYSKRGSSAIQIFNESRFSENNDIWRWETK